MSTTPQLVKISNECGLQGSFGGYQFSEPQLLIDALDMTPGPRDSHLYTQARNKHLADIGDAAITTALSQQWWASRSRNKMTIEQAWDIITTPKSSLHLANVSKLHNLDEEVLFDRERLLRGFHKMIPDTHRHEFHEAGQVVQERTRVSDHGRVKDELQAGAVKAVIGAVALDSHNNGNVVAAAMARLGLQFPVE